MKILLYQDYLRVGGTESHTLFLCNELSKRGHEVFLVTNRPAGALSHRLHSQTVRWVVLQGFDTGLNWWAPGLLKKIYLIEPDVVILMGRNANRWGGLIKKRYPKIKVISTVRTGRRLPKAYQSALKVSDQIWCNSNFARDRALRFGADTGKIRVFPNPCLRASSLEGIPNISRQIKNPTAPRFLYLAALVPGKQHVQLLEIFEKYLLKDSDAELVLAGTGPLEPTIKNKVKSMGLADKVQFLGFVDQIEPWFVNTTLVVSTSIEESMPNALVEAQYAGVPVVAYDVAGVGEIVEEGVTGRLIPVNDQEMFLNALVTMVANDELRTQMASAAIERSRRLFEPLRLVENIEHTILELVAQKD